MASATFIKRDVRTSGNWPGSYGAEGYTVLAPLPGGGPDLSGLPPFATVAPSFQLYTGWPTPGNDPRSLPVSAEPGAKRVAMAWYSDSMFSVDVDLTDGKMHAIAIYCVDWDSESRSQMVKVRGVASGSVLDMRIMDSGSFRDGMYLVWNVSGSIRISFTRVGGPNAVCNGIFLDPPVLAPTTTTLTSSVNPSLSGDEVTFTATVLPAFGQVSPTGTVTFLDNSTDPPTVLGTVTLEAGES